VRFDVGEDRGNKQFSPSIDSFNTYSPSYNYAFCRFLISPSVCSMVPRSLSLSSG
jgi:hypothetical protein